MVNLGFFNQRKGRVRPWLGWALNVEKSNRSLTGQQVLITQEREQILSCGTCRGIDQMILTLLKMQKKND